MQSRIAADAVFRISQLTAEVLAAPDDVDDDSFLTSDDDEDELEANELAVYGTLNDMWFTCVGKAFQIAFLNVIVLALV